MPDSPPYKVKIYDRPRRTRPSPMVLKVALLILLGLALFLYGAMRHAVGSSETQVRNAVWQNSDARNGR